MVAPSPLRQTLPALVPLAVCLLLSACGDNTEKGYEAVPKVNEATYGGFIETHRPDRLSQVGPQACVECHEEEVADWKRSHHAKANRPVSAELDSKAFTPARQIKESGVTYEMTQTEGKFFLRVLEESITTAEYELTGVIGETPIRQYLAELPGNKMQTISASYDVLNDTWVDVFAGQDRLPGEWGHWTGQGMNWNANCAYCHTTEYNKNYDLKADRYHSTWTQQGIACAACHTGIQAHAEAAKKGDYVTGLTELDRTQTEHNCATCHSRRDQLTADAFKPGDPYHDHFSLSLPDQPGLYHADGKILDEVFVYGSFQMSRMSHAGVSCMDCHNPHSMEMILPVENNMLCMRCHEAGAMNAPIIEPVKHSFHSGDSTGNRCVECHMPKTTYMQVDPRADHGFHKPDPLLTREYGIPNACSSCHTDKDLDWAIEWSEKWYGDKLAKSRQRKRAHALTAAYNFAPRGMKELLELLTEEDINAWRATYIGLLGNYMPNTEVETALEPMLKDESPLVRERAIRALSMREQNPAKAALDLLNDPSRSVRIAAANSLNMLNQTVSHPTITQELEDYLQFNADRPQSLLILANEASRAGETQKAVFYVGRAVSFDSANPEMYRQAAILLSGAGAPEIARSYLHDGWKIDPKNPAFPYSLGLLAAETNDLQTAVGYLEETVALEPRFYRAWYNLSLAYQKLNRPQEAARAMQRAQGN